MSTNPQKITGLQRATETPAHPYAKATFVDSCNYRRSIGDYWNTCGTNEVTAQRKASQTGNLRSEAFDPAVYLAKSQLSRKVVQLQAKEVFFCQGDSCDSIFYLQTGRVKLTVVSATGKEATVALLTAGDFLGEEAIAGDYSLRPVTATSLTACSALKIQRETMLRSMKEEHAFSNLFLAFLLARSLRTQADLVDQLFNTSEKRLARTLLLMTDSGKPGESEALIPYVTQEELAAMIGTTRSRVSFFLNRFRELGFIEYKSRIRVHKSLLNVVLH